MKRWVHAALAAVAVLVNLPVAARAADSDIVDTAVAAGSFKTLAAALQAADLVDALKGEGPFTVFAPTDDAFGKLPEGTVDSLLKPENKSKLVAVLTYHVVPGTVLAEQVVGLRGAKTLNGQQVDIAVQDGAVKIDSANVVTTDIECTNGVIHVIDSVILPASNDIVATAEQAGSFGTLLAAAKAAGLAGALQGDGPLTVFAPTDEAFGKLPEGTVESLLKPENKSKLAAILKYHVVSGRVYSGDALAAKQAETLQGGKLSISVDGGTAKVNSATLVATDIDASNGVIHVIDSVLLPPAKGDSAADARRKIEKAVARGSHLYNTGHHAACAKLYMSTMQEIAANGQMPSEVVTVAKDAIGKASHSTCPTSQSWTLRHGLNAAYRMTASVRGR